MATVQEISPAVQSEIDEALAGAPWRFEFPEDEAGPDECWRVDAGQSACETHHADSLVKWCDPCRDRYLDALALGDDYMGGIEDGRPVSGFAHSPESIALIRRLRPGLLPEFEEVPSLTMDQWIDGQADAIRAHGSDLAAWLAGKVSEIAGQCRALSASTPDQFDDRDHIMRDAFAEIGGAR